MYPDVCPECCSPNADGSVYQKERRLIVQELERAHGTQSEPARSLRIGRDPALQNQDDIVFRSEAATEFFAISQNTGDNSIHS